MKKPARLALALPLIVQALMLWCNSGTLVPYAATLRDPLVDPSTGYLFNVDHGHNVAPYRMLDGQDRSQWETSVVLRRVLYHALFFPLFKVLGLDVGGLAANVVANAIATIIFVSFLRRRVGPEGAKAALWTLATYPGIAYWGALPYSYAAIVPASLLAMICLWKLSEAQALSGCMLWSLLLGIDFTAYDLFPFFGGAAGLILLVRSQWLRIPIAAGLMMLPSVMVVIIEKFVFGVSPLTENTEVYFTILASYGNLASQLHALGTAALQAPAIFAHNFLFSNFLFLPALFAVLVVWSRGGRLVHLQIAELALLLTTLGVFLFNNLAPPYDGWQMRGLWISRLYQPVFAAYLIFVARWVQLAAEGPVQRQRVTRALVAALVAANASVSFGGVLRLRHADLIYAEFYKHSATHRYLWNLGRYGCRPVGFPKQTESRAQEAPSEPRRGDVSPQDGPTAGTPDD